VIPPRENTDWRDDPDPGNWTGTASMPRSAQHENVAIHLYAPQYVPIPNEPFRSFMRYEPYTHAYFPQDHFDEVVRDGHWTFARFRDGFVGLYSWRPPARRHGSRSPPTAGAIFDLIASGRNVWIVECGRAADWGPPSPTSRMRSAPPASSSPGFRGFLWRSCLLRGQ
jgi:hypothetical protein